MNYHEPQFINPVLSLLSLLQAILDKIAVALGGRAAEDLFVKRITTGASDDLDKAQHGTPASGTAQSRTTGLGRVTWWVNG